MNLGQFREEFSGATFDLLEFAYCISDNLDDTPENQTLIQVADRIISANDEFEALLNYHNIEVG